LGLRLVFDRCGDVLVLWVLCVIACAGERIRSRCERHFLTLIEA